MTRADVRALGRMLTRAFWDDPITEWLLPDERARARRMPWFWKSIVGLYARSDRPGFLVGDRLACAMWAPPKRWRPSSGEMVRKIPSMLPAVGRDMRRMIGMFRETERRHPRDEHWYLGILATDPAHQGKGMGSALLSTVLPRCDDEGLPAYLETSKESNVAFYRRHGFVVTDQFTVDDSPPVWLMWRDPKPG